MAQIRKLEVTRCMTKLLEFTKQGVPKNFGDIPPLLLALTLAGHPWMPDIGLARNPEFIVCFMKFFDTVMSPP